LATRILVKLSIITHYDRSTWHLWHFQGHAFKDQGHRQHFRKMHPSGGGTPTGGSPPKTI